MATLLDSPETPRQPQRQQFTLPAWVATAPFEDHLAMTIAWARAGEARLTMPFLLCHANGGGVMHGGALVALADTAVAMAIKSLLPAGTRFATTELTTAFLAPVTTGTVVALARVHGPEGRTFRGEAEVQDATGRPVARLTCLFRIARDQGFADTANG